MAYERLIAANVAGSESNRRLSLATKADRQALFQSVINQKIQSDELKKQQKKQQSAARTGAFGTLLGAGLGAVTGGLGAPVGFGLLGAGVGASVGGTIGQATAGIIAPQSIGNVPNYGGQIGSALSQALSSMSSIDTLISRLGGNDFAASDLQGASTLRGAETLNLGTEIASLPGGFGQYGPVGPQIIVQPKSGKRPVFNENDAALRDVTE